MKKFFSSFAGLLLIVMTFGIVFLTALTYNAVKQTDVKSYIFQMNNSSRLRVGPLQDISEISAQDLRNKLLKKYVFEYFKVIPGERNVLDRPVLRKMSSDYAYTQWVNGEALVISDMSEAKMFRTVRIMDDGIITIDKPADYNYNDKENAPEIFYEIHYLTETWKDSNIMMIEPEVKEGILFIQVAFKPGLVPDIDVKKALESGVDPVELFMFEVTHIGSK